MPDWGRNTLEVIGTELQRPVRFDESFDRRVMVAVRRSYAERRPRGAGGWISGAVHTKRRPACAAALAAGVVAVVTVGMLRSRPETVAGNESIPVQFV